LEPGGDAYHSSPAALQLNHKADASGPEKIRVQAKAGRVFFIDFFYEFMF